jgi:hypothetical protein
MIVHLRLGRATLPGRRGAWVAECGHYASEEGSVPHGSKALVTCKLCKRTRAYKGDRSFTGR